MAAFDAKVPGSPGFVAAWQLPIFCDNLKSTPRIPREFQLQ